MLPAFLRCLIGAAILTLVAAAPAAADSIAYVKAGDVWLTTPDGTRQVQVTRSGNYSYVSQADDGTMIALASGERLHKLSRSGAVLADFLTYVSDGAPQAGGVNQFHGPFNPEISPDGTKVAFEWFNDTFNEAPGCSEQTVPPCAVYHQNQGVGISASTGYTGPEAYGLMTGWTYPNWMSNDVLLRSFSGAIMTDDAVFTRVAPGLGDRELDPWFFDDQQGFGVDDVELSRDLQTIVGIAGGSDEKLRVYRTTVHPYGAPNWNHQPFYTGNQPVAQRCYELDGKFESTTLAPSGQALAYGTAEGIHVASIPGGCAPGDRGALVIPGGRFPDWGPADVPAASAAGGSANGGQGGAKPGAAARPKLTLKPGKRLAVTLTTAGPGKATVTVKLKGRTLGSARGTVKASGKLTLRIKLKKARGKATVKASFKPAGGGATQTTTAKVTLRR